LFSKKRAKSPTLLVAAAAADLTHVAGFKKKLIIHIIFEYIYLFIYLLKN